MEYAAAASWTAYEVQRLFPGLLERLALCAHAAVCGDDARMLIGVISDTHGLMRPEAAQALAGSELIIHAGDVGDPGVLEELRKIAPVVAVRGNIDRCDWLPEYEMVERAGASIYILHDLSQLDRKSVV